LNNKINLFNENSQQYENKVKELVNVIIQFKQNNNNGAIIIVIIVMGIIFII